MNATAKIELALDIYRLCKTEPKFFRAWVRYRGTDRDVWRKETIPESQFGFALAAMRNPTGDQEIGCITEFLDEEKGHIAGTPKVAYVPHDPEETTFVNSDESNWLGRDESKIKLWNSGSLTVEDSQEVEDGDIAYRECGAVVYLLNELEKHGVDPEDVTINVED